jgi:preprotein translocase subunit SecG
MHIEDNQGHTSSGHEGHDAGRPESNAHPSPKFDAENPGYETQDVNAKGIAVFLTGLAASLVVFFFLCFFLGKLINTGLAQTDGKTDKWHQNASLMGNEARGQKRQDLTSDAEMERRRHNAHQCRVHRAADVWRHETRCNDAPDGRLRPHRL